MLQNPYRTEAFPDLQTELSVLKSVTTVSCLGTRHQWKEPSPVLFTSFLGVLKDTDEIPPSLLFSRLNNPSLLSLSIQNRCLHAFIILVAFHWTTSSMPTPVLYWGPRTGPNTPHESLPMLISFNWENPHNRFWKLKFSNRKFLSSNVRSEMSFPESKVFLNILNSLLPDLEGSLFFSYFWTASKSSRPLLKKQQLGAPLLQQSLPQEESFSISTSTLNFRLLKQAPRPAEDVSLPTESISCFRKQSQCPLQYL